MAVEIKTIQAIPYFATLANGVLNSIRHPFFEKTVARGEFVLLEGEPVDTLLFVVSGVVKVFKTSPEGKEQILRLAVPHEALNESSIFGGAGGEVSAQALGPIIVYGIMRNDLYALIKKLPELAINIIQSQARWARQLMGIIEDLSFKNVIGRVAGILLRYVTGENAPKTRLTQQDMAAMAGTVREMVARSLKQLEDDGFIRFDKHHIIVIDRPGLSELAESHSLRQRSQTNKG